MRKTLAPYLPLEPPPEPRFDGATFDPECDSSRLKRQLRLVFDLMKDCRWRTLAEIAVATGQPQASVSARLRDLRKDKFGAYTVSRRRRDRADRGIFEYQVSE